MTAYCPSLIQDFYVIFDYVFIRTFVLCDVIITTKSILK